MLVKDLLGNLDAMVPFSWAEEWDNSGLLVGDPESPVTGVVVSLDPTPEAVGYAVEKDCSVLVSHHPLIFSPLKKLDVSTATGKAVSFALKKDIAVISMHTNWDSSPRGVNAAIAAAIGLESVSPLVPSVSGAWGLGALGNLPSALTGRELGQAIRSALMLSRLDLYGDSHRPVYRLALCGGSGGGLWDGAKTAGADAYFTSDVKYHERLEALYEGLILLIGDHGEVESFSLDALAGAVSEASGFEASVFRSTPRLPVVID
ncbi:Nif3-like dinuclear metal center hexameric protein [Aminivibrio sp.]|uniref:Nif3-like dinuclear metal center hexameric protein n=1 Tax=Aminivibrio sp. TaxID=1872489 RepID=UPI001A433E08|nr:Nif3-like dinuclear metal center hexameric protein [Aminivibrio sp.]MBL3538567.1 Nif3-like dinuclear metal center hexameric protein [Aminivibrio sp.]